MPPHPHRDPALRLHGASAPTNNPALCPCLPLSVGCWPHPRCSTLRSSGHGSAAKSRPRVTRSDLFVFPKGVVAEGLWASSGSPSVPAALSHRDAPTYADLQGELYGGPRVLSRMNHHHEVEREHRTGRLDFEDTRPF